MERCAKFNKTLHKQGKLSSSQIFNMRFGCVWFFMVILTVLFECCTTSERSNKKEKCPSCHKMNYHYNQFCVSCGTSLKKAIYKHEIKLKTDEVVQCPHRHIPIHQIDSKGELRNTFSFHTLYNLMFKNNKK